MRQSRHLVALSLLSLCIGFTGCRGTDSLYHTWLSAKVVPANGISSVSVVVDLTPEWSIERFFAARSPLHVTLETIKGAGLIRLGPQVDNAGRWRQDLVVGQYPGEVVVRLTVGESDQSETFEHTLVLAPDDNDSDDDGFPNALELETEEDRFAFRSWFTSVASSQVKAIDADWHTVHQDCAGLLRFSYKEALRKHDNAWLARRQYLSLNTIRDVERYNYPDVPLVGTNIFKIGSSDKDFLASANAKTLRDHNAVYIGHDLSNARNGDLLFYEYDGEFGRAVHSMILLLPTGRYQGDDSSFVVYHTGPSQQVLDQPDGSGEVRRVTLADLHRHPDPLWHPKHDNRHFSGVYRWNILQ